MPEFGNFLDPSPKNSEMLPWMAKFDQDKFANLLLLRGKRDARVLLPPFRPFPLSLSKSWKRDVNRTHREMIQHTGCLRAGICSIFDDTK